MWAFPLFSKSHIGQVNHGKSENICGIGASSTFLAVMRCSYQYFAVLRYSEPPNACLYTQAGEQIMEDVVLKHPIIFDIYNIRQYFHGHKLLSLNVTMHVKR